MPKEAAEMQSESGMLEGECMTQTPQTDRQDFDCILMQLQQSIEDAGFLAVDQDEPVVLLPDIIRIITFFREQVRSRSLPASTAAPEEADHYCQEICDANSPTCNNPCYKWLSMHDATVRQRERETLTKELIAKYSKESEKAFACANNQPKRKIAYLSEGCTYKFVIEYLESLRGNSISKRNQDD